MFDALTAKNYIFPWGLGVMRASLALLSKWQGEA